VKIRVIGVPSTWGAPGPGAQRTPDRLRAAGIVDWLEGAGIEVEDGGDVAVAPQGDDDYPGAEQIARVAEMARNVHEAAADALADGCLPLLVGGECSLAIGAVPALAEQRGAATVAWLDAHGDLNTPQTSASGLVTGMPLAVVLGHGHDELTAVADGTPRPEGAATFLIGARDVDPGEADNLAAFGVRSIDTTAARSAGPEEITMQVLGVPEIAVIPPEARAQLAAAEPAAGAALEAAPRPPVYLHFDVDVIDPAYAPGVYFGVDGGFEPSEVATLAGYLCASGCVDVIAIASANLDNDVDGRTVAAVRDVVVSLGDALATTAG
jgi:arginase